MQIESIVTVALVASAAILLIYLHARAVSKARSRGFEYGRGVAAAVHEPLMAEQKQARLFAEMKLSEAHARLLSTARDGVSVTNQEIALLIQVANTLDLARRTWEPLTGAKPHHNRAVTQLAKLETLTRRLTADAVHAAQGKAA